MSDPNACPRCGYFTIQAHSAEMCCELLRKEVAARDTEVAELEAKVSKLQGALHVQSSALAEFRYDLERRGDRPEPCNAMWLIDTAQAEVRRALKAKL